MSQDWIAFYKTYGIEFSSKSNNNYRTTCFDCGENKLYIKNDDGTYVCKMCDHKGNHYQFIKHLHSELKQRRRNPLLKKFAQLKKIPLSKLKDYGFVQDDSRVYIPRYGLKGTVVSLHPFSFKNNIVLNIKGQSPRPNFWRYTNKDKQFFYV